MVVRRGRTLRTLLAGSLLLGATLVTSVIVGSLPASATPTVFYAAATVVGTPDCLTPATACTLGTALGTVAAGDTIELVTSATDDASGNVTSGTAYPGNLTVGTSVTIDPYGTTTPILDGGNSGTVLTVNGGVSLTISGVTIQHGSASYGGGGIYNGGTVNVTDSTLSGNSAPYDGGGIYNGGTVNVTDSTLSGNSAGYGGGIYNPYGTVNVTDSTLSNNSANFGGGGIDNSGTVNVTDSTLSGNSANFGGGILNYRTVNVTDSTLSGNSARYDGGGIYNNSGATVNLGATIVANSSSGGDCFNYSTIADQGYNIAEDASCGFTATGSVNSSPTLAASLGILANNGGPTQTLLPASTSPAVGVIPTGITLNGIPVCPRSDQRGVTSVGNCTIGAVEVPLCATGLTPHVLKATYGTSTFTGLFCVNPKGIGTYTQNTATGTVSGIGSVTTFRGTRLIGALGKNLLLGGSTNGTKSGFVEVAPVKAIGTFTLS